MDVLLVSKDPLLKSIFSEISAAYSSITPFYLESLEEAISFWLDKRPSLTIFDVELPFQDPTVFITKISEQEPLLHSSRYFLFISPLEPLCIEKTKNALKNVNMGDFLLKGLHNEKYSVEEIDKLTTTIRYFYEKSSTIQKKQSNIDDQMVQKSILNKPELILRKVKSYPIELIVIGISTGGPLIINKLLSGIKELSHPIVIVQHMFKDFLEDFVNNLRRTIKHPLKIATQGEILKPGIYFAPDGAHLKIQKIENNLIVLLEHSSPIKGFLPSVEATFSSLLMEQISCLGILMTGLGNDGVDNLTLLHKEGNPTIAQSPEDAVAYGMPSSLIRENAADAILSVPMIAQVLNGISEIEKEKGLL